MRFWIAALAAFALLLGGPASAHHSFGMFDVTKRVTIEGEVKAFQFMNPHSFVIVTVKARDGKQADWWIETSSLVVLRRQGWTRTSMKAGDKASLIVNPLREGRPGGNLVQATINGQLVGRAAAPLAPAASQP